MLKSKQWQRKSGYALSVGALVVPTNHAEQIGMESTSLSSSQGMAPKALTPYWSAQGVDIQPLLNKP